MFVLFVLFHIIVDSICVALSTVVCLFVFCVHYCQFPDTVPPSSQARTGVSVLADCHIALVPACPTRARSLTPTHCITGEPLRTCNLAPRRIDTVSTIVLFLSLVLSRRLHLGRVSLYFPKCIMVFVVQQ